MKATLIGVVVAAAFSAYGYAQEREVPKDSARITVQGCARGRTFITGPRSEHTPGTLEVEPGRRFRLNAPRKILDEIKMREATMVEVTGLVRKGQLSGPGGVAIAGGRIRLGGAAPQATDPIRNPAYNEVVLDVEGWRSLPDECPSR